MKASGKYVATAQHARSHFRAQDLVFLRKGVGGGDGEGEGEYRGDMTERPIGWALQGTNGRTGHLRGCWESMIRCDE